MKMEPTPPRRIASNFSRSARVIGRVFDSGIVLSNSFVAASNSAKVISQYGFSHRVLRLSGISDLIGALVAANLRHRMQAAREVPGRSYGGGLCDAFEHTPSRPGIICRPD